jgi:hypothetical protein
MNTNQNLNLLTGAYGGLSTNVSNLFPALARDGSSGGTLTRATGATG